MYYVYVAQSEKDERTYIGKTSEVDKRIREHNQGKTKSLRHRLPVRLVYYEAYASSRLAGKREYQLKNNSWEKEKLFERIFE